MLDIVERHNVWCLMFMKYDQITSPWHITAVLLIYARYNSCSKFKIHMTNYSNFVCVLFVLIYEIVVFCFICWKHMSKVYSTTCAYYKLWDIPLSHTMFCIVMFMYYTKWLNCHITAYFLVKTLITDCFLHHFCCIVSMILEAF